MSHPSRTIAFSDFEDESIMDLYDDPSWYYGRALDFETSPWNDRTFFGALVVRSYTGLGVTSKLDGTASREEVDHSSWTKAARYLFCGADQQEYWPGRRCIMEYTEDGTYLDEFCRFQYNNYAAAATWTTERQEAAAMAPETKPCHQDAQALVGKPASPPRQHASLKRREPAGGEVQAENPQRAKSRRRTAASQEEHEQDQDQDQEQEQEREQQAIRALTTFAPPPSPSPTGGAGLQGGAEDSGAWASSSVSYEQRASIARESRETWKQMVETMTEACKERGLEEGRELQQQLRGLKKDGQHGQKEAILRFLHVAHADGLLHDVHFSNDRDNSASGWASFRVRSDNSQAFFERLVALFGHEPHQVTEGKTKWRTVNNSLERFGLRPDGARGARSIWAKAYSGTIPFVAVTDGMQ